MQVKNPSKIHNSSCSIRSSPKFNQKMAQQNPEINDTATSKQILHDVQIGAEEAVKAQRPLTAAESARKRAAIHGRNFTRTSCRTHPPYEPNNGGSNIITSSPKTTGRLKHDHINQLFSFHLNIPFVLVIKETMFATYKTGRQQQDSLTILFPNRLP